MISHSHRHKVPVFGTSWLFMHIGSEVIHSVVFFGLEDARPGRGGITCIGTGFLLHYDGVGYLVTAKHLSHDLGGDPFLIRLNKKDGTSENLHADNVPWLEHPDSAVDLSIVPLYIPGDAGFDVIYLHENLLLDKEQMNPDRIGVGYETNSVGLFRLMSGEKRNLPICHTGHIAMMPQDEKIPIIDWTDPDRKRRIFVEGILVEQQSLSGLSGSPVFVKPEWTLNVGFGGDERVQTIFREKPLFSKALHVTSAQTLLLGVWQGSWEAPPDEVRSAQSGAVKVPVGVGVVVPCYRILELLEMSETKKQRDDIKAAGAVGVVQPQSVGTTKPSSAATDENPKHREDFTSLVNVAARKRPQGDQT